MATYKPKPLNDKDRRWAEEYLTHFSLTKASLAVGTPYKNARYHGRNQFKKAQVKAYIKERLEALEISSGETTKILTDIAKANLSDYFIYRWVPFTPKIEVSLKELIKKLKADIEFEQEYVDFADLDAKSRRAQDLVIKHMEATLLRYEMELARKPKATRIVDGETILVEKAELDIVALTRDGEAGRIKAVKPTEWGLAVTMYDADSALEKIGRVQGIFEKDNNQQNKGQTTVIDWSGKYVDNGNNANTETNRSE